MSGCKNCSSCSPEPGIRQPRPAEKLEMEERSDNPRYPHLFEGKQAIYTDESVQAIVTVVADRCDDTCDCFTIKPERVIRDVDGSIKLQEEMEISKPVADICWRLHALL